MHQLHCLLVLSLTTVVTPSPSPGRIPKVYNALITSNQNLEPSKAYPVYQPVIHDATFTFPLQSPFYFGHELPIGHGFIPAPAFLPKLPSATPVPPSAPSSQTPDEEAVPTTEQPAQTSSPNTEQVESESQTPKTPPPPPSTESPIPLNEFGLPPQILPINRNYNGFSNIGHFTYTYPTLRFYDPFDPFGFHPYAGLPLYHPITNFLGQYESLDTHKKKNASEKPPVSEATSTPPPEPSDLNVLNYSPKDPEIANVPPPPLPEGGLKSDKSE